MIPDFHEENIDSITKSPYTYDRRSTFHLVSGQEGHGISPGRLDQLIKKGHLTERSERIIQFLYELQYLTGHLIQCCFYHPHVRLEHKKLRYNAKNPYLSEIQFLIRIGAILQYGFYDLDTAISTDDSEHRLKGGYIYHLTSGCIQWAQDRFYGEHLFSNESATVNQGPGRSKRLKEIRLDYMWLLSLLSFNQFHIAMSVNYCKLFTEIGMAQAELPFGFYIQAESIALCAFSIRNYREISVTSLTDIVSAFLSSNKHIMQKAFVIISESTIAAAEIWQLLRDQKWPYLDLLLFTADYITKDAKDPLKDDLIRFTGSGADYEICSLCLR